MTRVFTPFLLALLLSASAPSAPAAHAGLGNFGGPVRMASASGNPAIERRLISEGAWQSWMR